MVSYRFSPPANKILCSDFKAEFKSPALQCQTCKIYYLPICAKMPLYYMVRNETQACHLYANFARKNRQNLIHWTETVHLFKDCYPNRIDIENPLDKNETDVRVEKESISPTNHSNSKKVGKILKTH